MTSAQLQLIHSNDTWKLDRRTVEIGRAGIAQARAALDAAEEPPYTKLITAPDEVVAQELFADFDTHQVAA